MEDVLIVIFIAETDPDYVYQISADVQKQFQKHLGQYWCWKGIYLPSLVIVNLQYILPIIVVICVLNLLFLDSGLIEIISPPGDFYPDLAALKQTLGEDWGWQSL